MRLTPLDIKKQEFSRGMRGYDADEVQAFLSMMANQWEEMQAEQRRTEEKIRDLKAKMEHYERVEVALQEALQTARDNAKQALDNAKQEAKLIVKKAMSEADDLSRSATQQRDALANDIENLLHRRSEIVARLRGFLNSEGEILARFEERENLTTHPAIAPAKTPKKKPVAVSPALEAVASPAPEVAPEPEAEPVVATESVAAAEPVAAAETVAVAEPEALDLDLDFETPVVEEVKVIKAPLPVEGIEEEQAVPEPETVPKPDVEVRIDASVEETFMPVSEAHEHPALQISIPDEDMEGDSFYRDKEPLSFKFFEPNEERPASSFFEDGKEKAEQFGPNASPVQKPDREPVSNETWIVRPETSPEAASLEGGLTASAEEIEKIRRILNDLE